jgi:hypothetical protein
MFCFMDSYPPMNRCVCTNSCLAAQQVNSADEQDILTPENGADTLFRNVGNKLLYAAPQDWMRQLYRSESLVSHKIAQLWLASL